MVFFVFLVFGFLKNQKPKPKFWFLVFLVGSDFFVFLVFGFLKKQKPKPKFWFLVFGFGSGLLGLFFLVFWFLVF